MESERERRLKEVENKIQLKQQSGSNFTSRELEKMADFLLEPLSKEEKKDCDIIQKNRETSKNERELSYEGLNEKLLLGEDGIQNFITNDKNVIFRKRKGISQEDIETIPNLKEIVDDIAFLKQKRKEVSPDVRKKINTMIIQLSKEQYELKKIFKKPIYFLQKSSFLQQNHELVRHTERNYSETIFEKDGEVCSTGKVSLSNPNNVKEILRKFHDLYYSSRGDLNSDIKWVIDELISLIQEEKEEKPLYYDILILRIAGYRNTEIQQIVKKKYNINPSLPYLSNVWKHKIPRRIAEREKTKWTIWYWENFKTPSDWKKCSRCQQIKPKTNRFFSKNDTSPDGLYSICKSCRNKRM